jgi:hypothetical protein
VLLFYPEAHPYHDLIADARETDTVGAHLDEVPPQRLRPTRRSQHDLGGRRSWMHGRASATC